MDRITVTGHLPVPDFQKLFERILLSKDNRNEQKLRGWKETLNPDWRQVGQRRILLK